MKRFLIALLLTSGLAEGASYYYSYSSGNHTTSSGYTTVYSTPVFRDDTVLTDSEKFFETIGRDQKKYDTDRLGRPHAPRANDPSR